LKISSKLAGFLAFSGLLVFYFLILSVLNSPAHAFEQFASMWYWIVLLAIGFGVQVGLFVYAHSRAVGGVAASGGVSGLAMVACCAHHLTNVLPLIGLAAFTVFLAKYQTAFIVLGLASNAVGIAFIMREMQRHGADEKFGFLKKLDFNVIFKGVVIVCAAVVMVVFIAAFKGLI
jgi:hypothetical protein